MAAAADWERGEGKVEQVDIEDRYVERLLKNFDGKGFRIGWDAGNGAAGPVVEKLTARLPGEHHLLYTDVDSRFPNHHPDPTVPENLKDLQEAVRRTGTVDDLATMPPLCLRRGQTPVPIPQLEQLGDGCPRIEVAAALLRVGGGHEDLPRRDAVLRQLREERARQERVGAVQQLHGVQHGDPHAARPEARADLH